MTDREQESLIRTSNERANFKSWCREIAPAIYESTREAMWQAWKARSRCPVETSAVLENERMESSNEQVQTADIEACRAWLVQSRTSVFGSHQIIAMLDELLKCRHAVETSAPLPFAQRYRPITNGAAFMGMVAVGRPNAWGGQQCDYVQAADYDRLVALIRPSAVKATASPNDALRWICPTCRTVNAIEAAHCEIRTCNTPRPNESSESEK